MDAIERVEVSVKTQLIYALANKTQAFGYTDPANFPNLIGDAHKRLIDKITFEKDKSQEIFVEHYQTKYGAGPLPIWMVCEIVSFGCMLTMYKGVKNEIKKDIAVHYKISDEVFSSWLQTINVIRNICAHHGRLWNRGLRFKPFIPKKQKYPDWHVPIVIPQDRIFGILTILRYLLKNIAPQSNWESRLFDLLDEYPEIYRPDMGFPNNWKESPLWKNSSVSPMTCVLRKLARIFRK